MDFSTTESNKKARALIKCILGELKNLNIPARQAESVCGIKIPNFPYNIMTIREVHSGSMLTSRGRLEVKFPTVFLDRGRLAARTLKESTENLESKAVEIIRLRYEALKQNASREEEERALEAEMYRAEERLKEEFPSYAEFVTVFRQELKIEIRGLNEDQVRAVFQALAQTGVTMGVRLESE